MPEEKEPEWAREARVEWRRHLQNNPDIATPERDGKILSKLLMELLDTPIEANSDEITLYGVTFRLERTPVAWVGGAAGGTTGGPKVVLPSICPVCNQEVLRDARDLAAVGAALVSQPPEHKCPGRNSISARSHRAEEDLIQAIRAFIESSRE